MTHHTVAVSLQFLLVNFVITTVLSFVINGYNFLFLHRRAVYLWFALVPMLWSVLPLSMAAWATDTYQGYVTSVVKSWGEHPQSDESESEGEDMDEYHDTLRKLQQSNCKGRSSLITSTNLLSSIKKKRLVLKKDRRMSSAASVMAMQNWDKVRASTRLASSDAVLSLTDIKNSETNISAATSHRAVNGGPRVADGKPKKSKFNFKTYVLYLEGVIHEVGFSIGGVVLSWDKVSSLGLLWFSLIAVFIQEVLFGSRKSTINHWQRRGHLVVRTKYNTVSGSSQYTHGHRVVYVGAKVKLLLKSEDCSIFAVSRTCAPYLHLDRLQLNLRYKWKTGLPKR